MKALRRKLVRRSSLTVQYAVLVVVVVVVVDVVVVVVVDVVVVVVVVLLLMLLLLWQSLTSKEAGSIRAGVRRSNSTITLLKQKQHENR